jgi:hypothetical protein
MYYSLVDLEGKTLDSFRDEDVARAALRATVEADPRLADEVLLLRNADDGEPAGDALMYDDLASAKIRAGSSRLDVVIAPSSLAAGATAALGYLVRAEMSGHAAAVYRPPVEA